MTAQYVAIETARPVVQIDEAGTLVVVIDKTADNVVVEVGVQGPTGAQGIQGVQGIQGPTGPQGPAGFTYTHNQLLPAQVWTIAHGQNNYPAVTLDVLGKGVSTAKMDYTDANTVTITFGAPYAGKAYLKF